MSTPPTPPPGVAFYNWSPPGKYPYHSYSDEEVDALLQRAAEALGRPCRYGPCLPEHRGPDDDGWAHLGNIGESERNQAYEVRWHHHHQIGWLWSYYMVGDSGAVRPWPFDPRPHPREPVPDEALPRILWQQMDNRRIGVVRMATLLDATPELVRLWLGGETPDPDDLNRISMALGVEREELRAMVSSKRRTPAAGDGWRERRERRAGSYH